jgi:hypothetical protein
MPSNGVFTIVCLPTGYDDHVLSLSHSITGQRELLSGRERTFGQVGTVASKPTGSHAPHVGETEKNMRRVQGQGSQQRRVWMRLA